MSKFELVLLALRSASAALQAAANAKLVYDKFRAEAERTRELTPEESAELDAEADRIEASSAQQLSGR